MKKIILAMVLALAFFGCSKSQTPENASQEIIDYMNKGDYSALWTKYISEQAKKDFAKSFDQIKRNPAAIMLFQTIGINEENIKDMTAEEYFIKNVKFSNDFINAAEKADKVFRSVEVKGDQGILRWKQGNTENMYKLIKQDKRWYMDLSDTK